MSACRRVAHGKNTGVQTIRVWRATVSRVIPGAPRGFRERPHNSMTRSATLVGPTTRDLLVSGLRKSKRDPEVKLLVVTVHIVQPRCTRWLNDETHAIRLSPGKVALYQKLMCQRSSAQRRWRDRRAL